MPANQLAPSSRYAVSPLVDLSDKAERERLSPSALRAFFNILEAWGVRDADGMALLGGPSHGTYYGLKKNPAKVLDQDRLCRVSLLVGIFKALNILYDRPLADAWATRPNVNRIFGGASPLSYMLRGGLPAMQTVRRLLDARRGQ